MSGMPSSLAAAVAPRLAEPLKIASKFLKKEKICYKMVYYTLFYTDENRTFQKGAWHLKG